MNKHVKSYLQALEDILIRKYDILSHKAKMIIQDSYVIECLTEYSEESLHEDTIRWKNCFMEVKMRDMNRIPKFTKELERICKEKSIL